MPILWRRISVSSSREALSRSASVEDDLTGSRLHQAREAAHDGGLARARKAHDDEDLALMDIKRGIAHGDDMAALADLACLLRRIGDLPVTAGEETVGIRAIDLPQVTAGKLHLTSHAYRFRGW